MKELWNKVKALWASFRAWKYSAYTLYGAAAVAVVAVAVVIVLCAVGPKGNDNPTLPTGGASMDGTNPTGGENTNTENTGATQGTDGTEGTEGTEATQPGNSTNPTNPSNPTNPTNPTQPTQPSNPTTPSQPTNPPVPSTPAKAPDSLILNADGSYGGTLNKTLYGEGAPKNGQYNVANSAYYTVNNDYYNMTSTSERIIFPKFKSYQQTMQDSSGLACLLMILDYMGKDTKNTYTELELVKKYEEVNNTTVYGNGTTEEGLVKLVNSLNLGYTATNTDSSFKFPSSTSTSKRMPVVEKYFTDCIKAGKFVLVRYQSPVGNGWKIVAGYDNLGNIQNTRTEEYTDHYGDDVVIFAEPFDSADHCQDGFTTERAQDFYVWWREMAVDGTVDESSKWSYVVIDPNLDITYDYKPVDETVKQKLYDLHMPLNPNGTYGGTRNYDLYGGITSGRGWWNHTDSNYYKISDFYNMGTEGSRILLKNYTVLQQTMSSTCGICATNSVLSYYGETANPYDMELSFLDTYESVNNVTVKGKGSTVNALKKALTQMGYSSSTYYTSKGTTPKRDTYEKYMQFIRETLQAGRPLVACTYLGSGHFITIIGHDTMGTDYIYDDVIIVADSCDYWDGYQDGYNVYSAYKFFRQHTNQGYSPLQSFLVVKQKAS